MSFPINLPIYVSPLQAIRSSLGDLGYGRSMQNLEPDLIRWCIEAQDLISRARTLKWSEQEFEVEDNKIMYCEGLQMVECVSSGGAAFTFDPTRSCGGCCTDNCSNIAPCTNQKWLIDEVYIHFDPVIQDGIKVKVKGLVRPMGQDGYPLVNEVCIIAIQEYVKWKICYRLQDARYKECEQRWYFLCRTARAEIQKYTEQQLQQLGIAWYAPRYRGGFYGAQNGTF